MDVAAERTESKRQPAQGRRPRIGDLMILIAGVALGFWLVMPDLKEGTNHQVEIWLLGVIGILGGLSLVGPPLLLRERWRARTRLRRPFGGGELLWFAQGMASWLMWPPVVYARLNGRKLGDTTSGVCYYYGTPLMAIYVTSALLAGGRLRKGRRRRDRSWRERFGLVLGLIWACTGLYILYNFYKEDFSK